MVVHYYPKFMKKIFIFLLLLVPSLLFAGEEDNNPCGGSNALLNIIDRPSFADSVCTVPARHLLLESGYQYQTLMDDLGRLRIYPNLEPRLGLLDDLELYAILPAYIAQTYSPKYGSTETDAGIKYSFGSYKSWSAAVEAVADFPDGSAAFGSQEMGALLNLIIAYSINDKLSLTGMLSGSTLTVSRYSGGQRFNSFNPDIVLSYFITPKIEIFGEVYEQTKTGPGQKSGAITDGGILFLITKSFVIDLNGGQRIYGFPGSYEHYVGAGATIML